MTRGDEEKMKVLVTGAAGFVGQNLTVMLSRQSDVEVVGYDLAGAGYYRMGANQWSG